MKWEISGTFNGETGVWTAEGPDEAYVRRRAPKLGIVVHTVRPLETSTDPAIIEALEPTPLMAVEQDVPIEGYPRDEAAADDIPAPAIVESYTHPASQLLQYHAPVAPNESLLRQTRSVPGYHEIQTGATWLRVVALLFNIVGGVTIGLPTALVLYGMAQAQSQGQLTPGQMAAAAIFSPFALIPFAILALIFFGVAAVLKMLASIGLAIRDIARNSFN